MYRAIYILWGLLPFALFCCAAWAQLKIWFHIQGRENPRRYGAQGTYCALCLAISIVIDQSFFESLVMTLTGGMLDMALARWFLYPLVLFGLSWIPIGKEPQKKIDRRRFVFTSW